jgi:hypothetical protein
MFKVDGSNPLRQLFVVARATSEHQSRRLLRRLSPFTHQQHQQ